MVRSLGSLSFLLAGTMLAAGCSSTAATTPALEVDAPAAVDTTLGAPPTGETVDRVEVERYVGRWYEVASIPQGFQARCAATTATYAPIDATKVSVLNECRIDTLDGMPIKIEGAATIVDPVSNAKLEVDFGFGRAPYWVVDLATMPGAEPYEWAIVSGPGRTALWILSRTPRMPEGRYEALLERLATRGFPIEQLKVTLQPDA